MSPHFFIHIPKTAGTSFRRAAQASFGAERLVNVYARDSAATSDVVHQTLYADKKSDRWAFYRALRSMDVVMVGGHVNAGQFVDGFGVDQAVTFLREPLQRTASAYRHHCRHMGYKNSFRAFFSQPAMRNRMSRMLQGVPIEALGVFGLTEFYPASLALINTRFGWHLKARQDNCAGRKASPPHEVTAEDAELFHRLNADDVALYDRATRLFEQRTACFKAGMPWVHGVVSQVTPTRVTGWAWWSGGADEPVDIEAFVNGELVDSVAAVSFRPGLARLSPPRGAHVGFSVPLDVRPGDEVTCRVKETGQWLSGHACVVPQAKDRK